MSLLGGHGRTLDRAPLLGHVGPEATSCLDAVTGGDPVGLELVGVAATRLVLASLEKGARHSVLVGRGREGRELALCAPLDPSAPVAAFLGALHEELETARELAWSDRGDVAERLETAGVRVADALSQVSVWCEGAGGQSPPSVTAPITIRRTGTGLTVAVERHGEGLPVAAAALARCVTAAMTSIAADPHQACEDVDVLGPEQRDELLGWSNARSLEPFPDATLTGILDEAAERVGDNPAVVDGEVAWSHGELRSLSSRAARMLADRHGIGRGDRVVLLLPRGPELVLAIVAVLRTGASFVPLDPAHPTARLARQVQLSGAQHVIGEGTELPEEITARQIPARDLLESPPGSPAAVPEPDDEAALFFTSGSTGLPRPVAVTHRQIAHKAVSSGQLVGFDADTRCALLSAISSDAVTYQVFTALAAGGCLVPVREAIQEIDPAAFWNLVDEFGVNAVNCVPSLLAVLVEGIPEDSPVSLRHCFLGGDEIPAGLLPTLSSRLRVDTFANLYGPVETTIETVTYLCSGDAWPELTTVPIGRPSPGHTVVVLDTDGGLAPVGVPGEIYVLGAAVVQGYLDDEPTGPGKFVESPLFPGARAFRTGDFALWRPDGELDFLGRRDKQIQVHGNRIELAEIETALSAVSGITSSAVVPLIAPPRPPTIVAAYTCDTELSPGEVRAELADRLPRHMVPRRLLRLDELPITPHGKVDRQAILTSLASVEESVWDTSDEVERMVSAAWEEALGQKPRSSDEDLFSVGGHSLTAALLAARLCRRTGEDVITVRQVFTARTPARLAAYVRESLGAASASAPEPLWEAVPDTLPASSTQRRMWFLEQYEEGDLRPYNVVEAFRLRGPIDAERLTGALNAVVERHQALRTVLSSVDDRVVQSVLLPERALVKPEVHHTAPEQVPTILGQVLSSERRRRIDLSTGPLLHASWITAERGVGTLVLSLHHATCDGWSMTVIVKDLLRHLGLEEETLDQCPDPIQYAEHCARREAAWDAGELERDRGFWREYLADPPALELPLDRPRPSRRDSAAGAMTLRLDGELDRRMRELCRELGTTSFTVLVAAVRVLLYRLCRADDIALGTVVAGRDDPRLAESVGMFANTVVMRSKLAPERCFRDLVGEVAHDRDRIRPYDEYPFEDVVGDLGVEREAGRNPVFDVFVESASSGVPLIRGSEDSVVEHLPAQLSVAGFDLVFSFSPAEDEGSTEVTVGYRKDVFDHVTVVRMSERFRFVLRNLLLAQDTPISSVVHLPPEQREELLGTAVGDTAEYPAGQTLLDVFRDRLESHPDLPAVVFGDRTLSFAQLDHSANVLAARLARVSSTGPGCVVALVCEKTERTIVALIAALKTGSAFLPLDARAPRARQRELIRSSGATGVLADPPSAEFLTDCGVPVVDISRQPGEEKEEVSAPVTDVTATDLAYVIYTSGSSGTPKGVMIEHRAIVNTVWCRVDYYGLSTRDRILQVSPAHFDAGVGDILTGLAVGALLVVVDRDRVVDPEEIMSLVNTHGVTHSVMPPILYELLLDCSQSDGDTLHQICLGGERVTEGLVAKHDARMPGTELHQEYGPTEDSMVSTLHRIDGTRGDVELGFPCTNKWVDLIGEDGELVPFGAEGEMCLGGAGLARGYLGDEERTAERFVPNPHRPGQRMYRTGDLARRLSNGSLLYLGRMDDQVKIQGQRVEPSEVASVLSQAQNVSQAAVIAAQEANGDTALIAYFVGDARPRDLADFLSRNLPSVMVPASFVKLPRIPTTPNGKLDRKALPAPVAEEETGEHEPLTADEEKVARVWSKFLERPITDPGARLFDLGAHSLTAARIAYELGVPVRTVFEHQTLSALARAAADSGSGRPPDAPVRSDTKTVPLTGSQLRVWVSSQRTSADTFVLSSLVRLGRRLDAEALRQALAAVVERQDALRSQVRVKGSYVGLVALDHLPDGVPLVVTDLAGAAPDDAEVTAALREARSVSFDLEHAPLFEIRLLSGVVGGDLVIVTAHHLIYDAASAQVLLDQLLSSYDRIVEGQGAGLPELSFTFRDWVAEEQRWLETDEARDQEEFWRGRLAGATPAPDVTDADRRTGRRGGMGIARRSLPSELLKSAQGTPFTTVVTAFTALVHRVTDATDVTVGFAASLRHHPGADALVGFLINVLPLRLEFDRSATLESLLEHTQDRLVEAYENARLPFDVVVDRLSLVAPPGRSVLLDLGVSWENGTVGQDSYVLEDLLSDELPASSDMWLYAGLRGDRLCLDLTYDDNLIRPEEADSLVDRLVGLVSDVVAAPETPLAGNEPRTTPSNPWSTTHYDF